jgi:hypothetical protein
MLTDLELAPKQEAIFRPGRFVLLRPESNHPDAGRVGRIISRKGNEILVEFFRDDLIGRTEYCLIPLDQWSPVPASFVERYEPRPKKRGWRVTKAGIKAFRNLGWEYTEATEGKPCR